MAGQEITARKLLLRATAADATFHLARKMLPGAKRKCNVGLSHRAVA